MLSHIMNDTTMRDTYIGIRLISNFLIISFCAKLFLIAKCNLVDSKVDGKTRLMLNAKIEGSIMRTLICMLFLLLGNTFTYADTKSEIEELQKSTDIALF